MVAERDTPDDPRGTRTTRLVLTIEGAPRLDLDHDMHRVTPGELVLDGALAHPNLPEIVAALRARGAQPRVALTDDRLSRPLATRLREIGIVGIEVAIEGLERLHDRCHGLGSWRARLGSLRAARRAGLGARARVLVETAIVDDLPALLALLEPIASDVVLVETGPLTPHERERALMHGAELRSAQWAGFALHGAPATGAPTPITTALWRALSHGIRLPRAEAGTIARTGLAAIASEAGGLRALGLDLAAMRAPAEDLPLCLGGRGRALPPTTHVASCLSCSARPHCAGMPTEILDLASGALGPLRTWRPLDPGARVHVCPSDHIAVDALVLPALVQRFEALGMRVWVGQGPYDDAALVIAWNFEQALAVLDDASLPRSARVVVGDFRLLMGREAIASRARSDWPDERLEVVSAFPSFAHLYRRAGIPLDRITFRPYPIGPLEACPLAGWAFATSGMDNDRSMLEAVVDRLAHEGPTIRVLEGDDRSSRAKIESVGPPSFDMLVDQIGRARFVVMPLRWDRNTSSGGMPLALAHGFGRPIVTTRVPMALDHLRDGIDAILVDPGDVRAMADAVHALHHDEALRRALSEGAARRSRAGSAAAWAEELVRGVVPATHHGPHAWP